MKKRAQVSLFIIIGLLILILAIFLISYTSSNKITDYDKPFSSDANSIKTFTESCIEGSLERGIFISGFTNLPAIEDYVNSKVQSCTDGFVAFEGTKINEGSIVSKAILTEDKSKIILEVDYPLSIEQGETNFELSTFSVDYNLKSTLTLPDSINSDLELTSQNGMAKLKILKGTNAFNQDGSKLDHVSILIQDTTPFLGDFLGRISYKLEPEGARFNPPIQIEMRYNDYDIPIVSGDVIGNNENSDETQTAVPIDYEDYLSVAYIGHPFDSRMANPVPSQINKEENKISANIDHFSNWAIVSTAANQDFKWKLYTSHPGDVYNGRRVSVRLPSCFYNYYGLRSSNSGVVADGTSFNYYQLDKGESGVSNRLSYSTGAKDGRDFSNPVDVIVYKDRQPFAKQTVSNPGSQHDYNLRNVICLSPLCGAGNQANIPLPSGSTPIISSGSNVHMPSSAKNCGTWDYDHNSKCPAGYVNCDSWEGCGRQGSCDVSTCG